MTLQANQRFFVEKLVGWNFSRQIWGRTYRASLPFAPGQSLHRAPATAHPATVTSHVAPESGMEERRLWPSS
jgi:hypothetical protein